MARAWSLVSSASTELNTHPGSRDAGAVPARPPKILACGRGEVQRGLYRLHSRTGPAGLDLADIGAADPGALGRAAACSVAWIGPAVVEPSGRRLHPIQARRPPPRTGRRVGAPVTLVAASGAVGAAGCVIAQALVGERPQGGRVGDDELAGCCRVDVDAGANQSA